ncbi:hypothetical protein [Streptomyces sp. NPDC047009]|uniref:hypothetical protein n=1 Tax=unclassified Streptomyces TaxID=2593676 RepID=UPI0033E27F35
MTDAPDRPFSLLDFPADLRAAQRTAAELYAYQATLPWSREPHPGWPEDTERGTESRQRSATDGWSPDQAAEYDRLFAELRAATAAVQCDPWWKRCKQEGITGADLVATRQALKRAEGAVPLGQNDVAQTA